MQDSRAIERFLSVLGHNNIRPFAIALIKGDAYEKVFETVPTHSGCPKHMWHEIAECHKLAVAWNPGEAHKWFEIASKPLMTEASNRCSAYVCGSVLGLLEASIWLSDTPWITCEYNIRLLEPLMQMICGPLQLNWTESEDSEFTGRLSTAIKQFLSPKRENLTALRTSQLREFFAYIKKHGSDDSFSALDKFILERMSHGLLARSLSMSQVSAIDHLLQPPAA